MQRHITTGSVAGLLLAAALLPGCAHHPTIVGTWIGLTRTPQGATAQSTFTFTPDGQETMAAQISNGPIHMNFGIAGAYTVSGTSLTQTINSATFNGKTMLLPPQSRKTETDQFTLNNDTLTLTKPGSPIPLVLTRQKS